METEQVSQDSSFNMSDMLESINNGVSRFNMSQLYPLSGNVSSAAVGSGSASGLSVFQFQDAVDWWCPSQSYFHMQLKFRTGASTVIDNTVTPAHATPTAGDFVTYCDNFVCTLFSQINSQINSQPLDTITTPWLIDTALGYSKAHWNFIKTYASMTRMGESLQTRLLNVSQNGGIVEVSFRPPLSLFDVKILPPGAQFRIDFTWASNALQAFESLSLNPLVIGNSATNFNVDVNSFSFYKASVQPAPGIALPKQGVIDLSPSVANQYYMIATQNLQANITLPATTNRILVVFQDINNQVVAPADPYVPVDFTTGVGGGYNPATSFSTIFTASDAAATNATFADDTVTLSNLWLSLPELGIQEPKPQYNFTATNGDMIRAYSDWAHICQGTYSNYEGSLPYGNNDPSKGTQILFIDTDVGSGGTVLGTPTIRPGDSSNYQQFCAWGFGDTPITALAYNQTSRWGWSGSRPGPIFAFPVVRPEYKHVTQGVLYATLSSPGCKNVAATVIATYSMAIAVEDNGMGLYSYKLITGV